jgi:hypothetical protein
MSDPECTWLSLAAASRQSGKGPQMIRGGALRNEIRTNPRPGRPLEYCLQDCQRLQPVRPGRCRQLQPAGT